MRRKAIYCTLPQTQRRKKIHTEEETLPTQPSGKESDYGGRAGRASHEMHLNVLLSPTLPYIYTYNPRYTYVRVYVVVVDRREHIYLPRYVHSCTVG